MQKHIYNLSHAQRKYLGHILNSYPDICKKPPEQRTRNEQRRVTLVKTVLDEIDRMPNAAERRALVDMLYFTDSHYGIPKAAKQIPVSDKTAQTWNAELLERMAELMQLP
ncbi:MAG: hypothetical protein Q4A63_07095 [Butyricicoccus pullicaecorum]|nr:hypothetical protein [Butyricicoccus pullicaecorum]